MRILAYCVMPNHWHFVLWPTSDGTLSRFVRWLSSTHAQRRHVHRNSIGAGHLYQGRFKSFVIQSDHHFLTVCRYVEANPLRAGLVSRAEDWRWSSLWRRGRGHASDQVLLSRWPTERPADWTAVVNESQPTRELSKLRESVKRNRPFGDDAWTRRAVESMGLGSTLRPRGRPRCAETGAK
jgi:putative transposase